MTRENSWTKGALIILALGGALVMAGCRSEPPDVIPTYDVPTYEEPTYDEPTYDLPTYEEPTYDEPTYDLPTYEEPTYDLPTYPDGGDTNPCAFPGDLLCPHTPITVPGPLLPDWG